MNKFSILLISGLTLAACSGNGSDADKSGNDSTKTIPRESYETSINIRYVSIDSIYTNYELAKIVYQEAQTLASELQAYQNQLQNQLQSQYNQIQQKAQTNQYLSQASYEADLQELEKKGNSYQAMYAKKEQDAAKKMDDRQKELKDSIDNFIEAYNKDKKYDAILIRDAALYFNPAIDITGEIIEGLNKRYTGTKASGDAPAKAPASSLNTPANPATLNAPSASEITPTGK